MTKISKHVSQLARGDRVRVVSECTGFIGATGIVSHDGGGSRHKFVRFDPKVVAPDGLVYAQAYFQNKDLELV